MELSNGPTGKFVMVVAVLFLTGRFRLVSEYMKMEIRNEYPTCAV